MKDNKTNVMRILDQKKIEYTEYTYDEVEDSILATTYPGYTESVSDALKEATWRSFGLYLGVKYSF